MLRQVPEEVRTYSRAQDEHDVLVWLEQLVQGYWQGIQTVPLRKYPGKQEKQVAGEASPQEAQNELKAQGRQYSPEARK